MKQTIAIAAALGLLAAPAFAQSPAGVSSGGQPARQTPQGATQQSNTTATTPNAVNTTDANRSSAAPVPGANSYTEGQARARLEEKGFGNITELKKDEKGIWRASAMKDGRPVPVALDFQGNVVSN